MSTREEIAAAKEQLHEAIQGMLRAVDDEPGLLTDWVVVTAETYFEDEGRGGTGHALFMSGGEFGLPGYRTEGLLRAGLRHVWEDDEDDD